MERWRYPQSWKLNGIHRRVSTWTASFRLTLAQGATYLAFTALHLAQLACCLLVLGTASFAPAQVQQYIISTYVGGTPPLTPARGLDLSLGFPGGVAVDRLGNVYFIALRCVFQLNQIGIVTRIAGNSRPNYSGDGGLGTDAGMNPRALAVDGAGNIFIADEGRVRKVAPSGIISTVAGGGTESPGDGGPATNAQIAPTGVAVDRSGNLFISEFESRVRKVPPSGIITTVAGTGSYGFSGDGGPATIAKLTRAVAVAVDRAGNLFIADWDNNRIREVSPDGIITTVAGNGLEGFSGDGGPAASAGLSALDGLAVDDSGNLFINDALNSRIRQVSLSGTITTVAGNGSVNLGCEGCPATGTSLYGPSGLAVDGTGNLFFGDAYTRVRKVSPSGIITTVAGDGSLLFAGDGGPAINAQLDRPDGLAVDKAGNLFIADEFNRRIREVSPNGIITTVAGIGYGFDGDFGGDGGPAKSALLSSPKGVVLDGAGNLFIADFENHRVRKISPNGIITTVAGNGSGGCAGDGGTAINATLALPAALAVDGIGNLFIADSGGNCGIRKVSPDGVITTVFGNGSVAITADLTGNLFIAEPIVSRFGPSSGGRILKLSPGGTTDVVAHESSGLNPLGVAVDAEGNLFVADHNGYSIRRVSPSGIITTLAGNGTYGFSGDGGPATSAALGDTVAITLDHSGNVYVADSSDVVHILRPTNQSVLIAAVMDAASERADSVSPGKIVVIYGGGLGPKQLIQNEPSNGQLTTELSGTAVSFNGIAAPIIYTSATQAAAIVPYSIRSATAQVVVTYQGHISSAFTVPVAASAPSLFTLNQTGAGQAAAFNAIDGTVNTAVNPARVGGYVSLYATGEGQTAPVGVDGALGGSSPTRPVLPVRVTVGGIPATVQYAGGVVGQVAGLMQVNVQIPGGVQPGGYVPVVLQVGDQSSSPAVWIAVTGN